MVLKKIDAMIAKFEDIVSGTCLAAIVCIATMSVFGRYVLHVGFLWADEVNQALLVAVGMIGSARAVRYKSHAEFTSFINNLKSKKAQSIMRFLINALTLGLLVFMFIISFQFMAGSRMVSTVLRVPRMYYYLSIPIGFGLCLYEYIKVFVKNPAADISPEEE